MGMKKSFRVKKAQEFQHVFRQGRSKANRQFVVYVLANRETKHFRIGISVGKKIGNAVVRNAVKRKIRQAVQELKPILRPDRDFIVIARKPAAILSTAEIKHSLLHVFRLSQLLLPRHIYEEESK